MASLREGRPGRCAITERKFEDDASVQYERDAAEASRVECFADETKKKRPMGSGALDRQCRVREIMPATLLLPDQQLAGLDLCQANPFRKIDSG